MSVGRPTILGDNAANRELFTHGEHAWMVRMGDPAALADGIRALLADADLRRRLSVAGSARARECGGARECTCAKQRNSEPACLFRCFSCLLRNRETANKKNIQIERCLGHESTFRQTGAVLNPLTPHSHF